MKSVGLLVIGALVLGGCTYRADTNIKPANNIYSNYGDKIPGKFAIHVDADEMKRDFKPNGYACSAHVFPVDARNAFKISTVKTFQNIVEELEIVLRPLTREQMVAQNIRGMIIVEADDLDVDLRVIPGFWSQQLEADAEITARMTVDGEDGRLLGTAVEGSEDAIAESGMACSGGGVAVGDATEAAMKEVLERLGERLSNADRLRG